MNELMGALLTAARYPTKTEYIIIVSACAGGILLLMLIILAVRMHRYKKKLRIFRAATETPATMSATETPAAATPEPTGTIVAEADGSTVRAQEAEQAFKSLTEAVGLPAASVAPAVSAAPSAETVARKKAEIIALRGRLKNPLSERDAVRLKHAFIDIAEDLTDEERASEELNALLERSVRDADKAARAARRRRLERERPAAPARPLRPALYDEFGRPVYLDESGRPLYIDENGLPYYRERPRGYEERPRAIDRDRAEKERLYRERQRRLRERDDR